MSKGWADYGRLTWPAQYKKGWDAGYLRGLADGRESKCEQEARETISKLDILALAEFAEWFEGVQSARLCRVGSASATA